MRRIHRSLSALLGATLLVGVLAACEPNYGVKVTDVDLTIPCGGSTTVRATWAVP